MSFVKIQIRSIVENIVKLHSQFIVNIYKLKNYNSKRILIYTDSRGYEISSIFTRKSYRKSFIQELIKKYNCDVFICPEKHTTFYDFFETHENFKKNKYDFVVCLIGVVDFSPRPLSQIEPILKLKKYKISNNFTFSDDLKKLTTQHDAFYNGETTSSLVGLKLVPKIVNKLNSINNLIWISCNPIDLNWRGNYFRDRPENINYVNEVSKSLISHEKNNNFHVIDHTNWNLEEVRKYTCDNIHYSKDGMRLIKKSIIKHINND
jgi:hypothetical protein